MAVAESCVLTERTSMTVQTRFLLSIQAAALCAGCTLFFNYPEHPESDADAELDGEEGDRDTPDTADPEADLPETEADPDPADPDTPGEELEEDVAGEDAVEEEVEPYCGDGEQNGMEECDDGNDTNGDGCDNDCTYSCTVTAQETDCDDGESCTDNVCDGSTHVCSNPPVTEGTPCNDGDDCTYPDTCSAAGTCTGVTISPCQTTWIVLADLNQSAARGTSITETADGGYVVVGASSNTGPGGVDMWMAKLTPVGSVLWQKAMGGSGTDYANDVMETSDGNLIVAGTSSSWIYGWPDDIANLTGYMVKLRPDGSVLWQKVLGWQGDEEILAVTETSSGNIAYTGTFDPVGGKEVWAGLMQPDGTPLWHATYGTGYTAEGTSIIETSDGNLLIGATGVDSPDYFFEGWLLKVDGTNGDLLWSRAMARSMINLNCHDVAENPATHGILFAGSEYSSMGSYMFGEVASDGSSVTWGKMISPEFQNHAINVILESGGGLLLSGRTGGGRLWTARMNSRDDGGTLTWNRETGSSGYYYQTRPNALIESASGHVVMSTWAQPSGGQWDILVVKLNASGSIEGTCGMVNDYPWSAGSRSPSLGSISGLGLHTPTNSIRNPSGASVNTSISFSFRCPE
jgi:cysteine-rich repeat protein